MPHDLCCRAYTLRIPQRSKGVTAGQAERYELDHGRKYPDVGKMLGREEQTNQHNKVSTKLESEKQVIGYWNSRHEPPGLRLEFSKPDTAKHGNWEHSRDTQTCCGSKFVAEHYDQARDLNGPGVTSSKQSILNRCIGRTPNPSGQQTRPPSNRPATAPVNPRDKCPAKQPSLAQQNRDRSTQHTHFCWDIAIAGGANKAQWEPVGSMGSTSSIMSKPAKIQSHMPSGYNGARPSTGAQLREARDRLTIKASASKPASEAVTNLKLNKTSVSDVVSRWPSLTSLEALATTAQPTGCQPKHFSDHQFKSTVCNVLHCDESSAENPIKALHALIPKSQSFVEWTSLKLALIMLAEGTPAERLRAGFSTLDTDGDQHLSGGELKALLLALQAPGNSSGLDKLEELRGSMPDASETVPVEQPQVARIGQWSQKGRQDKKNCPRCGRSFVCQCGRMPEQPVLNGFDKQKRKPSEEAVDAEKDAKSVQSSTALRNNPLKGVKQSMSKLQAVEWISKDQFQQGAVIASWSGVMCKPLLGVKLWTRHTPVSHGLA